MIFVGKNDWYRLHRYFEIIVTKKGISILESNISNNNVEDGDNINQTECTRTTTSSSSSSSSSSSAHEEHSLKRDRNGENESLNEIESNQNRKKSSAGGSDEKSESDGNKIDENDFDSILLTGKINF